MRRKDLLNRIKSLDEQRIEVMSLEVMPTLTDNFEESLVRALVLRGQTNYAQRKIFVRVKEAYNAWMKNRNPYWGSRHCPVEYPSYIKEMQLDIECGWVLAGSGMIGSPDDVSDVTETFPGYGGIDETSKTRIEKLEAENAYLKSLLLEDSEQIQAADKIRLELLLRLMEKDGADLDDYGNKTNAAKVAQLVTGLPPSTCKNYCTNRDLNTNYHADPISKVNQALNELDMGIRL